MLTEVEIEKSIRSILLVGCDLGSSFSMITITISAFKGVEPGRNSELYLCTQQLLKLLLDQKLIRILDQYAEGWPEVEGNTDALLAWTNERWSKHDFEHVDQGEVFFYETTEAGCRYWIDQVGDPRFVMYQVEGKHFWYIARKDL